MMWVLLFLLFTIGCSQPSVERFSGVAMTVPWQISIGETLSPQEKIKIQKVINEVFFRIDTIYNKWNLCSELSRFNQAKAYEPVEVSSELIAFLKRCKEVTEATKGVFDPTIEPIQKIWREHLTKKKEPPSEALEEVKKAVGWDNIFFLSENTLSKRSSMTALDLCGIVKGYCVDLLLEALQKMGYTSVLVDWGGELKAVGKHPEGRSWNIAIRGKDAPLQYIALDGKSLATSGNYLQKWEVSDHVYTHVIDTKRGQPKEVKAFTSATVIAKECLYADAIATTLLLLENEDVEAYFNAIKDQFLLDTYFFYTEEGYCCKNNEE